MRTLVVGYGVQGKKRKYFASTDCMGVVDPITPDAQYRNLLDVPLNHFDSALVCTPDEVKIELIQYLLENGKHVLVEKPLVSDQPEVLLQLKAKAEKKNLALYTAYNHRFEPHFVGLREVIDSGRLGELYWMKMFYANGTARDVRNSAWRDQGSGVLDDIGSHLLDTIHFWFREYIDSFQKISFDSFENKSYDRILFSAPRGNEKRPSLLIEATTLSWRNAFSLDLYGEKGTAHIECLCKWGPSTLTVRGRVLPSGKPPEESRTLECPDPTWTIEYDHFKKMCQTGGNNIENDLWILKTLKNLRGDQK